MQGAHQKNVKLLVMAQACFLATSMTMISFAALAGKMIAPTAAYATLPVAFAVLTSALTTAPMSLLMQRTSRRFGFRLGAFIGIAASGVMVLGVYTANFYLLCVGAIMMGPYHASAQYYRFAAAESVPADQAPRAISLVLIGGLIAALFVPSAVGLMNDTFLPFTFMGAFVFVGVMALVALIPLSMLEGVEKPFEVDGDDDTGKGRPLGEIVKQGGFIVAVINGAAGYIMMSFIMTATPLAMEACGFGPNTSAFVIQGHVIGMFLPSLFTGHLIMRFGLIPILLVGHAMFAIAFATALEGIQIYNFSVALIALGVGWNFCFIGGSTLLTRVHTEAEKGRVQGLNEFIIAAMASSGALASGFVLAAFGWENIIKVMFVVLALAAVATILYGLKQGGEHREAAHK